jgi:hypothetical protein
MKKNLLSAIATGTKDLLTFNNSGSEDNSNTKADHYPSPDRPETSSRNIVINDVRLSDELIKTFERDYHTYIADGMYWYDRKSGAWGMQGEATLGFIPSGLELGGGLLKTNASNGKTGVFVNGRRLHWLDVIGLQSLLGVVWPGRFWVDAQGNYGFEGGMMLGNLWALARQRRAAGTYAGTNSAGPWATYAGGGMVCGDGQGFLGAQFGENTYFT